MSDSRRTSAVWLRLNGYFLAVMGSGAATMDVVSYAFGRGPWGTFFHGDPLVITGFEAHVLAVVLGILLIGHARSGDARWHLAAAAIELTLGASNIVWFDAFHRTDTVPMGFAITLAHAFLLGAQLWAWARRRASAIG